MSSDISTEDLENIRKMMQSYINDLDEINDKISDLVQNSNVKTNIILDDNPVEIQKAILENRDRALSIGFIAISTIALVIRRFRTAAKLIDLFIQLVNQFVSLITRYEKLFKVSGPSDAIQHKHY